MRRAGWLLLPTAVVVVGVAGVAAAGPGSPVTIAYAAYGDGLFGKDGNNASPIVASVRVPRGNYAINGKVTINNRSEKDGTVQTGCWLLSAGELIDIAQGALAESGVLEPNATMVVPLQGIAKFKSPKTIAIRCHTDSRKVAHAARLTAIKVTRVSFQAPG